MNLSKLPARGENRNLLNMETDKFAFLKITFWVYITTAIHVHYRGKNNRIKQQKRNKYKS